MDTAKTEPAADDLKEKRRRWEGIHDDEAAQYRLPLENASPKECAACCILPGLGVAVMLFTLAYGLFKLIGVLV